MISIVLATKNEEKYIRRCLGNLEERISEIPQSVEVIVIDSSEDSTPEIARESPVVDKVYRYSKEGVLNARDFGFRKANGDIIVSWEVDSIFKKNYLRYLLSPFRDEDVVMTYGLGGSNGLMGFARPIHQLLMHLFGNYAYGGNRAMRKWAYIKAGGYDLEVDQTDFWSTMREEEFRFPTRMNKYGKVVFVPEAKSIHSTRRMKNLFGQKIRGGAEWILKKKGYM